MLQAELKVIGGKHEGKLIPLPKKFIVGREQDCHLRPNSELVSRHHCVFTLDDYTLRLRDLGSTNGTFVNDEWIKGQIVLKKGDQVRIGKLDFEVVLHDQAKTETNAPTPQANSSQPASGQAAVPNFGSLFDQGSNSQNSGQTLYEIPALPPQQNQAPPPQNQPQYQPQQPPGQYPGSVPGGTDIFGGDTSIIGPGQPPIPAYLQPPTPPPYQQQPQQPYPPQQYPQQPQQYPQQPNQQQPPQQYQQAPPQQYQQPPQQQPQQQGGGTSVPQLPPQLPPPESTGAQPVQPPQETQTPAAKPPNPAEDIIKQYMNRRPESS